MNAKRREPPFECGDLSALDRFAQGALPDREREGVESHLNDCASCREIVDDFSLGLSMAGLIKEAREEVPNSLRQKLIHSSTRTASAGGRPANGDPS